METFLAAGEEFVALPLPGAVPPHAASKRASSSRGDKRDSNMDERRRIDIGVFSPKSKLNLHIWLSAFPLDIFRPGVILPLKGGSRSWWLFRPACGIETLVGSLRPFYQ